MYKRRWQEKKSKFLYQLQRTLTLPSEILFGKEGSDTKIIFLIYVCQEKLSIMHRWIKVIWQSCLMRHFRQILQWTCKDIAHWITFFEVLSIFVKMNKIRHSYFVILRNFICWSCFFLWYESKSKHLYLYFKQFDSGSTTTVPNKLYWEISQHIPLKFNIFHPFTRICKSVIRNLLMVKIYH